MRQFKDNVFTEAAMNALIDQYSTLITPYAIGAEGGQNGYTYPYRKFVFYQCTFGIKNVCA